MSALFLDETFGGRALDHRLRWFCPPQRWRLDPTQPALVVEPDAATDFWQRTHYGFSADNGHFLGMEVTGDFLLSTQVAFAGVHQYDQAGLMIRANADCWVKTSVEHELDTLPQLGVVVTQGGYSDWSMQDLPLPERELMLRLAKQGADLTIAFSGVAQERWKSIRVAHWQCPEHLPVWCGLYACSPKEAGFRAQFKFLRLERS